MLGSLTHFSVLEVFFLLESSGIAYGSDKQSKSLTNDFVNSGVVVILYLFSLELLLLNEISDELVSLS